MWMLQSFILAEKKFGGQVHFNKDWLKTILNASYIWFAACFMHFLGICNGDLSIFKLIISSYTPVRQMPQNIKLLVVIVLHVSKYNEESMSCFGSLSARPFPTSIKWLFSWSKILCLSAYILLSSSSFLIVCWVFTFFVLITLLINFHVYFMFSLFSSNWIEK